MKKRTVTIILVVCIIAVIAGAFLTQTTLKKPEFHLFNLQYTINSQTQNPDTITFNIQNLGTAPATNIKVNFLFTAHKTTLDMPNLPATFTYTVTYQRDLLQSKEVRDGQVSCGFAYMILPHANEKQAYWDELTKIYNSFNGTNPNNLTPTEIEALMLTGGYELTPANYTITCKEDVTETAPFPTNQKT